MTWALKWPLSVLLRGDDVLNEGDIGYVRALPGSGLHFIRVDYIHRRVMEWEYRDATDAEAAAWELRNEDE